MEVASAQQPSLDPQYQNDPNVTSNAMDTTMDIDMDLDLGPLPEPEAIETVSYQLRLRSSTTAI